LKGVTKKEIFFSKQKGIFTLIEDILIDLVMTT